MEFVKKNGAGMEYVNALVEAVMATRRREAKKLERDDNEENTTETSIVDVCEQASTPAIFCLQFVAKQVEIYVDVGGRAEIFTVKAVCNLLGNTQLCHVE